MQNCLFCRLIEENKLNLTHEDDQAVAFHDIAPKSPIHLLIVPKKHISSVLEITNVDKPLLGHLFMIAKKLAKENGLEGSGFRLTVNTGQDAGQTIDHIHLHLCGGAPLGSSVTTVE